MKANQLTHAKATVELSAKDFQPAGDGADVLGTFEAVISSTKRDRDADIMEARGANVDPRSPLLWQHDIKQPIGRLVEITHRDNDKIVGRFELANTALGRDALTLLKMKALRLSHGFKPIDFEPLKDSGFHVKTWEITEVSLVSVPSNTDAIVLAIQEKKLSSPEIKSWAEELKEKGSQMPTKTKTTNDNQKTFTEDDVRNIVSDALDQFSQRQNDNGSKSHDGPNVDDLLEAANKGKDGDNINVKKPSELYSTKTAPQTHRKTGESIIAFGQPVESVPTVNHAKTGAFIKHLAQRAGLGVEITEHERALLNESVEHDAWAGKFGGEYASGVKGARVKALLDDALSGGAEVSPEFFDADLISFPLLNGELFPFVDLKNVPRGSAVEGASVGNPSVNWGTAEGTSISLFDTASLIAAIDTSIFPVAVALEVGRDLLADSPADLGRTLTENIGMRLAAELDRVIADGNGMSEPQGIMQASGVSTVSTDNGTTGPPTLDDYFNLLFAVAKQYRSQAMRCAFVSNDTTYQRSRQIKIDPGGTPTDQRPVFGLEATNSYMTLEFPHKIENGSLANTEAAFCALAKYRMYRRLGMSLEFVTGGKELARKNVALLIARARFGGQLVDSSAAAKSTDMQDT